MVANQMVSNQDLKGHLGIINILQGIVDAYQGLNLKSSKNFLLDIIAIVLFAIVYVIVFIPVGIISRIFAKKLEKTFLEILEYAKNSKLETDEDYDNLKRLYNTTKKFKNVPDIAEIPFYIRIFIGGLVPVANILLEAREVLAKRLYPNPEGVTEVQLKEIAAHLKATGFYERNADIFEDDDDTYDRAFALGKIKFLD